MIARAKIATMLLRLAGCCALVGCGGGGGDEILVFAAASTTDAMLEIGEDFHRRTGHEVLFSFAASSALARQIEAGAPADLFLSADPRWMAELARRGLVREEDCHELLSNRLVVIVPASSRAGAFGSADELASAARIAVGDPQGVPLGVYAKRYLESCGLWSRLHDRIVPAIDARAALAAVETAAADAGIVYASDAVASRRVRVAFDIPAAAGPTITYPVAVLRRSDHVAAAEFLDFLRGDFARASFTRHGFIVL